MTQAGAGVGCAGERAQTWGPVAPGPGLPAEGRALAGAGLRAELRGCSGRPGTEGGQQAAGTWPAPSNVADACSRLLRGREGGVAERVLNLLSRIKRGGAGGGAPIRDVLGAG